jgi:hypothetical protein
MSRLIVDDHNELREVSAINRPRQPLFIRIIAMTFSIVFHPLFIPTYLTIFIINIHPYLFSGFERGETIRVLLQVIVSTAFMPLVAVVLMKGLKFISSIHLKTQKDRIIPYIAATIFYFWNWYVFKRTGGVEEMTIMMLGVFISCIAGSLANIYMKVSMHATAMGMMVCFMGYVTLNDSTNITLFFAFAVIIAGLVCTSRMIVSDHNQKEIYTGLILGALAQLLAIYFT